MLVNLQEVCLGGRETELAMCEIRYVPMIYAWDQVLYL